ncbi:hypothetical protein EXN66_Car012939 [Channa argus]|uniref:Uncharacterized protein n=1 Tax=Channa argus TaxID=215402 RepID=A0A6G1Q490_CHAAH|nr:hypothetical protein EXN66_Car012939 [Channa argus]
MAQQRHSPLLISIIVKTSHLNNSWPAPHLEAVVSSEQTQPNRLRGHFLTCIS